MAENFAGKWDLVESENFDEYMKQVGVSFLTRKMAANLKPVLTINVEGNHWKMVSTSTFKTVVTEFDLDKEFEETTADGRVMKSTFKWEDGKLMQYQKKIKDGDKDSVFTRTVEGDQHIIVMESDGVKAKRIYKRAA